MALTRPRASQIITTSADFSDPLIVINKDQTGANANDIGFIFERGSDTNVAIIWDESSNQFALINTTETGTTAGNVSIGSYANLTVSTLISSGITYPTSDGTNGQVIVTNGSGTLSFTDISTSLSISGDSGTDTVNLLTDTLSFSGTANEITTSVTNNTVTIGLPSNITTNASTANAWATARTITLGGVLSGDVSIDGSSNVTLTAAHTSDPVITLTGAVTGSGTMTNLGDVSISTSGNFALGTDTTGNYVASITNGNYITGGNGGSESAALTLAVDATTTNTASKVVARDASGNFAAGTITANLTGNASTASAWATARSITLGGVLSGDVSIDGSSNVTLTAAHTSDPVITLTGDVTGSATMTNLGSVSITATVVDDSHNHIISNVDGLQTALDGKASLTGATFTGDVAGTNLTLSGNLTVSGTTTYINTTTLNIGDNIITLNADETGTPSQNAGIEFERGTSTNVILQWNETSDQWEIASGGTTGRILTTGDEGSGNGLDADTLDGQQGSYYLDWTNTTNKPDPVITLAGDLSGSATLTNLGNATLTATITKDPVITLTGDVTGSATMTNLGSVSITTTVAANSVALGTDTTGNYVATIAGTANEITVSGSGSENAAVTIALPDDVTIGDTLTVTGNLFVDTNTLYVDAVNNAVGVGTSSPITYGKTVSNGDIAALGRGLVKFYDSDSSNYVAFKSAATVATNVNWTLTSADGESGQVISTDGPGT